MRLALVEAHLKAENDRITAENTKRENDAKERAAGGRVGAPNAFEEMLEAFAQERAERTEHDARVDQRIEGLAAAVVQVAKLASARRRSRLIRDSRGHPIEALSEIEPIEPTTEH
jgi:hypothetical protein